MNRPTTRPRRTVAAVGALVALVAATVLSSLSLALPASAATYVPQSTDLIGPDVSSYQHPNGAAIDWAKVKGAGADFAFVKATEGTTYTNQYFAGDWAGIGAQGLYRGAYHYANPAKSPADQARYFVNAVGSFLGPRDLPPVLDLETNAGLSASALVSWTASFLADVQQLTGRVPMIYTYPTFWNTYMAGNTTLARYPLWIASYGVSQPQSVGGWGPSGQSFWQYTSSGSMAGIPDTTIDLNVFNGNAAGLAALVNTRTATGTNPSATIGALTGSASGSGTVTVTKLAGAPSSVNGSAPEVTGSTSGGFYVVSTSPQSFTDLYLRFKGTPSHSIFWWDGTEWHKLNSTTIDPNTGDLVGHLNQRTVPNVDQLDEAVFAAGAIPVTRVAGTDRLKTAVAASQAEYPAAGSAQAVVLARSDLFADALAGGPLAAARNAPVLLTPTAALDQGVLAEIQRVAPAGSTVYLLGSTGALSTAVENAVTAAGYVPKRVYGKDRYGTAVAIADELGNPSTVFEVSGLDFPDALAAGPAAITRNGAILLTAGYTQSAPTKAYLTAHAPATRYTVGGPAVAADKTAGAVAGADRYGTAARVATVFFAQPPRVGVARGDDFADAMVASTGLAATTAPLLLAQDGTLPASETGYVNAVHGYVSGAVGFGSAAVLPGSVLAAVQQAAP